MLPWLIIALILVGAFCLFLSPGNRLEATISVGVALFSLWCIELIVSLLWRVRQRIEQEEAESIEAQATANNSKQQASQPEQEEADKEKKEAEKTRQKEEKEAKKKEHKKAKKKRYNENRKQKEAEKRQEEEEAEKRQEEEEAEKRQEEEEAEKKRQEEQEAEKKRHEEQEAEKKRQEEQETAKLKGKEVVKDLESGLSYGGGMTDKGNSRQLANDGASSSSNARPWLGRASEVNEPVVTSDDACRTHPDPGSSIQSTSSRPLDDMQEESRQEQQFWQTQGEPADQDPSESAVESRSGLSSTVSIALPPISAPHNPFPTPFSYFSRPHFAIPSSVVSPSQPPCVNLPENRSPSPEQSEPRTTREIMPDPATTADGHSSEDSVDLQENPLDLPSAPVDKRLWPNHSLRSQILAYNERRACFSALRGPSCFPGSAACVIL